ncbi:hypothetical protein SARC_14570, partial [Sphaeroforma arctica JP610]
MKHLRTRISTHALHLRSPSSCVVATDTCFPISAGHLQCFQFPECQITEAMFRVDQPPEWVESDQCNNCRTYFGPITRKHHCRNCGNIFCNACSSNDDPIPKFGYEKPVRTCDSCHVVLQSGGADAAAIAQQIGGVSGGVPSGPSAAEAEAIRQREEDDLMQAIAQSLHIQ